MKLIPFVIFLALTAKAEKILPITEAPRCLADQQGFIEYMNDQVPNSAELLARLIFTEGLSTEFEAYCPNQGQAIFESIGWGVLSRLRLNWAKGQKPTLRSEILAPGQYNPSTSIRSPFHLDFACPLKDDKDEKRKLYWQWARAAAQKVIQEPEENPFLKTKCDGLTEKDRVSCEKQSGWEKKYQISLVTNFFYPKSTQAKKRPGWAAVTDYRLVRGLKIGDMALPEADGGCIQFFRHQQPFGAPKFRPDVQGGTP